MLIAKTNFNYSNGEVVTFKLITGEEIISRIIEDRTETYILNKPMSLLNTSNGGLGMMPIPIAGDSKDPIVLNKHAVAIHTRCEQELASQYLEKTTGLTIAKSF
jgi:hypothetical protein